MKLDVPTLVATYVSFAPGMDARKRERAWAHAQVARDFQLRRFEGLAGQQTEARVCYDRTNLYVRFECFQDSMDRIRVNYTEDHLPVWLDESIELYISPYNVAGLSNSHQFAVNASGAKTYLRENWVHYGASWHATVKRSDDRWTADITIPLTTLQPAGRNEECWRINFCRDEGVRGETSSWSGVPEAYSTFSRFGRLLAPEAPFRFNTFRGGLSPLKSDLSVSAGAEPIDGPVKNTSVAQRIIPTPHEIHSRLSKGVFQITPMTTIVTNDEPSEADLWAVDELRSMIEKHSGIRVQTRPGSALDDYAAAEGNVIAIGEGTRNSLLRDLCDKGRVRVPRTRIGSGTHALDVTAERILVAGQTPTDTYYGVQTLKQLIARDESNQSYIASVSIRDRAGFAFRGVHLLAKRDCLPFFSKLIENVLAPLKVNHIILQTDCIAWKSHPEIVIPSIAMPPEDVTELVRIARRHHVRVTPLVASPANLDWAFNNGQNLDIAEDPECPHCYCMSNPRSYEFIFSVMDEAIELFEGPEYLHTGREEFDFHGRIPLDDQCKDVGKERLYYRDTLKIHEHLQGRGCKMMMWGDVLVRPEFREMIETIPKDIVITDRHWEPNTSYPTVDFFQMHGFPVVGCTWCDPRNIHAFSRYAARKGIAGMLQSSWSGLGELEEPEAPAAKLHAYVLSSAWAWNSIRPDVKELPFQPKAAFEDRWRGSAPTTGGRYLAVALESFCNISREDSGRMLGWLGVGRGNDLRELPSGSVSINNVPYRIAASGLERASVVMLGGDGMMKEFPRTVTGIPVRSHADTLHFLHGCAYCADSGAEVGKYTVNYEDGQRQEIPLVYEKDICAWDDRSGEMLYVFAWRRKSQDGRGIGLSDLSWKNPRPDVRIDSVGLAASDTQASPFLLAITLVRDQQSESSM